MKSNLVSKSETASILRRLEDGWRIEIPRIRNLMVHRIDQDREIITGGGIMLLRVDGTYLPFLTQVDLLQKFPSVTVDMGAVRFMCNGANVMRPGIGEHTEFQKDDVVCVVEESRRKFLAVGTAMVSSADLDSMERGEVIRNMHYISDKFWEVGKTIKV